MPLYLDPIPSGQLTQGDGYGTPPLIRWMNAVRALFAQVPAAATSDIWRGKRIAYAAGGNATTLAQIGDALALSTGTPSLGTLATTTLLTSLPRIVCTTAAGANSQAGGSGSLQYWRGNAAGMGGFRVELDVGVVTTQTTLRMVAGVAYNGGFAVATSADPSAATDCVFLGCDAADTTMQIMHNDSSGTCTKIDLGASFPKTDGVVYRVVLDADANGSSIDYTVSRFDTSASASGTISSDLPTSSQFMSVQVRFGNGGTASAAAGAFLRYLGETAGP